MKNIIFIILFLALLFLGLNVIPIVVDTVSNSNNLDLFKKRIEALTHPGHTTSVTTHSRIGILIGSGNHCDYFIGHIRSFDGNKAAIQKHYSKLTFLNPVTKNDEDCEILFFGDAKAPNSYLPYEFESLDAWQVKGQDLTKLYVVSIFRSYDSNWDLRCR